MRPDLLNWWKLAICHRNLHETRVILEITIIWLLYSAEARPFILPSLWVSEPYWAEGGIAKYGKYKYVAYD